MMITALIAIASLDNCGRSMCKCLQLTVDCLDYSHFQLAVKRSFETRNGCYGVVFPKSACVISLILLECIEFLSEDPTQF